MAGNYTTCLLNTNVYIGVRIEKGMTNMGKICSVRHRYSIHIHTNYTTIIHVFSVATYRWEKNGLKYDDLHV